MRLPPPHIAWALVPLLAAAVAGCEQEEELPPPDATYTVRGVVKGLPSGPKGDLMIHHEAIDDFVDKDGNETGMKSMVMPFTPAKDLSLEGVSEGDKVKLTFEVRWGGSPMLRVTELEELSADTELAL